MTEPGGNTRTMISKLIPTTGFAVLRTLCARLALSIAFLLPAMAVAAGGENVELVFTESDKMFLWISLGLSLIAIVFGIYLRSWVLKQDAGTPKMQEVSSSIQQGAHAYLRKQVTTMLLFVIVLAIGLYLLHMHDYAGRAIWGIPVSIWLAISFILGVAASYIAGYVGMIMAVNANTRVAGAAQSSSARALEVAFKAGGVAGLVTVGMGLLGATGIFLIAGGEAMKLLIGFGFGGSLAALFMRVGGGIYTKAADVGADLVGKVEAGIPEDDPRNPATIADNVGDNVGDCAGMAADIFESYEVTLVAAIVLGAATASIFDQSTWMKLILFALMARGVGIVASILGIFFVRGSDDERVDPLKPIRNGFWFSAAVAVLGTLALSYYMMQGVKSSYYTDAKGETHVGLTPISMEDLRVIAIVEAGESQARSEAMMGGSSQSDAQKKEFTDEELLAEANKIITQYATAMRQQYENEKESYEQMLKQAEEQGQPAPDRQPPKEPVTPAQLTLEEVQRVRDLPLSNYTTLEGGAPRVSTALSIFGQALGEGLTVSELWLVKRKTPANPMMQGNQEEKETWEFTSKYRWELQGETAEPLDRATVGVAIDRSGDLYWTVDKQVDEDALLSLPPISYSKSKVEMDLMGTKRALPDGTTLAVFKTSTDVEWWRFFVAITFGVLMAFFIELLTDYFVSFEKKPVKEVASASTAGPAPMIIQGFAYGMESSVWAVFAIVVSLMAPLFIFPPGEFGGFILSFYGIALVGLGLLTTTGYILAMDTFGPISDNAQGVYEMSGAGHDEKKEEGKMSGSRAVQRLDAAGNTTKALTKGFAIATAVVAAVALFHAFLDSANLEAVGLRLDLPQIFIGMLIGGATPFLFSAFSINAVGRASFQLIGEVRRQFAADPGIMKGTSKPNYGKCVEIVTAAAQKELLGPGILAIALPTLVGFGLSIGAAPTIIAGKEFNLVGAQALGGFLAGAILTGQLLAVLLANSGGLWDNSKKVIEDGLYGGKGTDAHKAGVVCDTVGDPFKDTAGPALNPLIKVMNLVALLLAPVVILPLSTVVLVTVVAVSVLLLAIAVYWSKRGSIGSELAAAAAEQKQ